MSIHSSLTSDCYANTAHVFQEIRNRIQKEPALPYMPIFNYLGNSIQFSKTIPLPELEMRVTTILAELRLNPHISHPSHVDNYYISRANDETEFISARIMADESTGEITILVGTGLDPSERHISIPLFNEKFIRGFSSDGMTDTQIDWLNQNPLEGTLFPFRTLVAIIANYYKPHYSSARLSNEEIRAFTGDLPKLMKDQGFVEAFQISQNRIMMKLDDYENSADGGTAAKTFNISLQDCNISIDGELLNKMGYKHNGPNELSWSIIETQVGTQLSQARAAANFFSRLTDFFSKGGYDFVICKNRRKIERLLETLIG